MVHDDQIAKHASTPRSIAAKNISSQIDNLIIFVNIECIIIMYAVANN